MSKRKDKALDKMEIASYVMFGIVVIGIILAINFGEVAPDPESRVLGVPLFAPS